MLERRYRHVAISVCLHSQRHNHFIDYLAQKRYYFISMKRLGASLLALAITVLATTFAGMAIFGMNTQMIGMNMEKDHCMSGNHCEQSNTPGTSGMDCVSHCISATTTATTTPVAAAMLFVLFAAFVYLSQDNKDQRSEPLFAFQRWRECIRKLLLKQRLAVVMLRD